MILRSVVIAFSLAANSAQAHDAKPDNTMFYSSAVNETRSPETILCDINATPFFAGASLVAVFEGEEFNVKDTSGNQLKEDMPADSLANTLTRHIKGLMAILNAMGFTDRELQSFRQDSDRTIMLLHELQDSLDEQVMPEQGKTITGTCQTLNLS